MSAGDLTGFVMYSFLLAGNLSSLTSVYSDVVRAVAASDRIVAILDRPSLIPMATSTGSLKALEHQRRVDLDPLQQIDYYPDDYTSDGTTATRLAEVEESTPTTAGIQQTTTRRSAAPLIELHNLNFQYPARPDVNVLKNFSLTIQPGEVIALVGGSGSGKSTVASLLTRLYDPSDTTSIQLDGTPLADYDLQQVRHMMGVVSQDPVKVTDEDILHAAQQANVWILHSNSPRVLTP